MIQLALFCRNEAPRIEGAIASLRAQADALPVSLLPLQLVVLENGSTDCTAALARQAGAAWTAHGTYEVEVRAGLPAGKTRSWNAFLQSATSGIVAFMDADVRPGAGAIAAAVEELLGDPALDIVSAIPGLQAGFHASGFWQSVFAVPYHGLRPAQSVAGNLYVARRDRLEPLDPDILHEDLALSLRHEGAFSVSRCARVYVTPPRDLREFLRQRVRCLRADITEQKRFGKDVAPHRRRELRDVAAFARAGGPHRLAAFLFARAVAAGVARWQGPHAGGEWMPDAGR